MFELKKKKIKIISKFREISLFVKKFTIFCEISDWESKLFPFIKNSKKGKIEIMLNPSNNPEKKIKERINREPGE